MRVPKQQTHAMTSLFLLVLSMLLVVPSQTRVLSKASKEEELLPQDLDLEPVNGLGEDTDEDRILSDPCLETVTVYTDPDDNFFDMDLMQVIMIDVSTIT